MKKLTAFLVVASATFFTSAASAANVEALGAEYQKLGLSIVDMVNSRSVDVPNVEKTVLELTKISVALSDEYKKIYPQGAKLLDIVTKEVAVVERGHTVGLGPMVELPFQEIEDKWHDLGFTATQDVGIDMEDEDNEHFTDPLHVMVHPIMVLRAARDWRKDNSDTHLDAMKAEMQEGMEQVAILLKATGK